ncbi:NAD(P)-binding protein [Crepidotus variabilis]|uniref:NAD(P)-binding protein n=1 Tax=Crepidotus variabilis TaxID=179855 RepID=A0A9P6ELP1_9AGAR|nr:NAD(P)-binding protein [Crepidotus variabilis]
MSPKTQILVTGITGYIGGSVYSHLTKYSDFASFEITALIRSTDKAEKLKKLGIKTVVGAHDDVKIMESLAAKAEIVIAAADADNVQAATATLAGLKKRYDATGIPPTFIHTSGTGLLVDDAAGERSTDVVYDDCNLDQIESIPHTAPHRNVDLRLVNADKEGYVRAYIILPSTIYGIATGPLVEQGIQNPFSQQVPMLIRVSARRGRAGMVGQGKNIWPNVHINDVAQLYVTLLDSIRKNPSTGHGRDGYYFGENGEHTLYEVSKAIGDVLVAEGKADNREPTPFTKAELEKQYPGLISLGTNARCQANHSRSIGWRPQFSKLDLLTGIDTEYEGLKKAGRI